jgi:CheY-like chemotaxis protein
LVAGRKLLLADDSVTIQKVVDLTFADEGMQVTTVGNGALALQKLEEMSPDIVLVDIHMPGMSGYEVCEHIKRDERFRHIPVMLLVGSFEPFDEAEARRVGADDHLTKPFQSIRQLVSRVGALLGGRDTNDEDAPTKELALPKELSVPSSPPVGEMSREDLERSTANTAPLPRQVFAEAQQAEEKEEQQPEGGARMEASLENDFQEDKMTESAPLGDFSSGADTDWNAAQPQEVEASPVAADVASAETVMESPNVEHLYDQMQATLLPSSPAPERSAVVAASANGGAMMRGRMSSATLSDDTLLDLDDVLPSRRVEEADDFILDLQDEAFMMDAGTLEEYEEELVEAAPEVGEFAKAQLAGEEQRADFAPVEEQEMQRAEPQVVEAIAEPEAQPAQAASSPDEAHVPPTGLITLSQLSPEVIDAIARRAVEQISERVVEEVAWEVVPQLAELIIKRHLEREKAQTP